MSDGHDPGLGQMSPRRFMVLCTKWLVGVVGWTAVAGLLFHVVMGVGLLGPMRWANWGPGESIEALRLPDGRYAVALYGFGRIQIYSSGKQFLYGWNDGPQVGDVLRLSTDGTLNLYAWAGRRGGSRHRVYDVNGTLLLNEVNKVKRADVATLPGRGGQMIHIPDGSPWFWTFPFRSVSYAFATLLAATVVGIVLSFVLYTREEREAFRRKQRLKVGTRI